MENTKDYYTPELNEFHVGFEYEIFTTNGSGFGWVKEVFELYTFESMPSTPDGGEKPFIYFIGYSNEVRVKKLSKECIESLGWKKDGKDCNYKIGTYCLWFDPNLIDLTISNDDSYENYISYFIGDIKNKSELSKLMNMLNIKI